MIISNIYFPEKAYADTGTCCTQLGATCVVGLVVIEGKYYKEEGPC
jgi:hypothetical protein